MTREPLMKVSHLSLTLNSISTNENEKSVRVLRDVSFELFEGEILAIVGSSGSGKSLLAHSLLGLQPSGSVLDGEMSYQGNVLTQEHKEKIRGSVMGLVPQSIAFLDPLLTIGRQIGISIRNKVERQATVSGILQRHGLEANVAKAYPHQLSGGMARKVLLATALVYEPKILIADEPTPGLDEVSLGEVLKDLKDLAQKGKSIMLITHDIEAALKVADRVAIMYAGTLVEVARAADFVQSGQGLRHPYTKLLNLARPQIEFQLSAGCQPLADTYGESCPFMKRCPIKQTACTEGFPSLKDCREGVVRCHYAT